MMNKLIRLSDDLASRIESLADQHKRSFNSEVVWALERYAEREQIVQEEWQVRVDRGFRGEFAAYTGRDEQEAREQFESWKEDENVDQAGLYVNGNLESMYQRKEK